MRQFGVGGLLLVLACAATATTLAAPKPLPLTARVIRPGEFPPFLALQDATTLYRDPRPWVAVDQNLTRAQAAAHVARLRREGFVAGLTRQLGTTGPARFGGLSWVMQVRDAASARAELAANVRDAETPGRSPTSYSSFRVSGIPDARGYHLGSSGGMGDNVVFADGPFVYFVGFGWNARNKSTPTRAALIAAATRLYVRVHGHPPA